MNQNKRKKTYIHRKMTIWEMILCVVLIPNLILSCIMIAKSFASDGLSGFGAPIGVVTDSVNVVTENQVDYSDATSLDSFEIAIDADKNIVLLTKYIGSDTAVSVAPQYVINDEVYNTVLDSTTVFTLNTKITSVKLYPGVGFANNTMDHLFYQCGNLISVDMEGVNTTGVTDMSYVFETCSKLTTIDMTGIDTSKVTTMYALFSKCENLSSLVGYENWDTSSLENIFWMFNTVQGMEVIDISKWDLSKINNSAWCFQHCYAKQILLPDNLKTISAGFLNHAIKITGTSFTIPVGVEKIGYAHTIYDFATDDFVEFIVPAENKNYVAIDGILYSADGKEMLAVPRNKAFENNTYFIPEGVEFLGELSFSRNYNIHTLVLPNSYEITHVPEFDERYIVFEDIGNLNGGNTLNLAIYLYTGITSYEVKDDNPRYESVNGIIYSEDMSKLLAIPTNYKQYIDIPEGVTTWTYDALWFHGSTRDNISGVNIPSTMIDISPDQLNNLNNLIKNDDKFKITVHPDNPVYSLDENGKIVVTGAVTTMNETTRESYSTFAEAISNANDGDVITLLTDLSVSESINITSDLTLKSGKTDNKYPEPTTFALRAGEYVQEGNVIKRADGYTGTLFTVSEGATLTLDDGLIIDGGNNWTLKIDELKDVVNNYVDQKYNTALAFVTPESGAPIATAHMFVVNGSLVINNATIKNNIGLEGKSLIYVGMGGKLVMNDGAVITKIAGYSIGSVAFFNKGSTFDMNGGEISWSVGHENSALLNNDGAIMTMNGGAIENNHATNSMGMIMRVDSSDASYPAKLIINDGLICNNVALPGSNGPNGSVFDIVTNGYFEMHGGTMCHNVGRRAATINHRGVHAEITGGTIVDNVFLYTSGAPSGAFDRSTTITGGIFGTDIREGLMGGDRTKDAIPYSHKVEQTTDAEGDPVWIVREKKMLTVTFEGLEVSVTVLEDETITAPTENPTKTACFFDGWDYDFTQPITDNIEIKAIWTKAAASIENEGTTTYYRTLQEAIDAAEALAALGDGTGTQTINLLKDVSVIGKTLNVDSGNILIVGNGFKIIRDAAYTGTLLTVKAGATLTLDGDLIVDGGNEWQFNYDKYYDDLIDWENPVLWEEYYEWFTIDPNAPKATAFMIVNNGTLNLNEVTIQNSYSTGQQIGAVKTNTNSVTNLNGAHIHHIAAENGQGVAVMVTGSNAVANINDGTLIEWNHGGFNFCILYATAGGTLNIKGGEISNNPCWDSGGIIGGTSCTINMTGGKICSNSCANLPDGLNLNSVFYLHSGCVLNVSGGDICCNITNYGAITKRNGSTLNIAGGKFTDNTAYTGLGPDLFLYTGPIGSVTGGTFMQDVNEWCPLGYAAFDDGPKVGQWTVERGYWVTFTDDKGNVLQTAPFRIGATPTFNSELPETDNPDDYIWVWDNEFVPVADAPVTYTGSWKLAVAAVIKKDNPDDPNPERYYDLQMAIDAAEDGDTVVLLADIAMTSSVSITGKSITIDADNHTITRGKDENGAWYTGQFFSVPGGASLTLGGGLVIDGGNEWRYNKENGEYVLKTVVDNYTSTRVGYAVDDFITYQADAPVAKQPIFSVGGYLTVNDVTVQNNAGSSIFSVLNGGKLITNEDALFTHNASKTSGTVANVPTGAEFVMNGSTIRETVGGNHGGCILVNGGKFTMNSGLAEHNFTVFHASFLRLTGGQFVMNGGTIQNNASLPPKQSGNQVGSAIDVTYGATAEFNGGTVCNNYGYLSGGVNYVGGKIDINGGTFVNNTAWAAFDSDSLLSDVSFGKPGATVKGGTFGTEIYQACVLDANIDTIIPASYEQFVIGTDENGNPNLWEVVPGWNATFVDDKGNILQTGPVRTGDTPVFNGELPEIENEDAYLWVWDKEIVPITNSDVTYTGSWKLAVAAVIKKDNPNDPNPTRYYDFYMAMDAAEDGDTVVLLTDIEMNKKYTVAGKSITLDGDGYTITRGKNANGTWYVGNLFTVNAGAGLTLDGDLIIDGGNDWVLDETSYYEALRQANSTHYGAYAFVTAEDGAPVANARMFIVSGNLVINNVTIQNHMGGGVAHLNTANASMTLNDGALVKHCAHNNNGTLALMVAGTNLTINDGAKVTDNYFGYNGGMINAKSAVVTMNGGEISYSRGANSNGSVLMLINTDAAFYMNGGLICNNSSLVGENNGRNSAIQLRNNTMIMTGGTICNNEGYQFGGIDTNNSNSTLIISGGSVRDNLNYKEVDNWPKEDRDDIGGSVETNPSVSNNPNYSFTGGIFSQNVNYWTAKGYEGFDYYAFVIEENEDGTPYLWEVAKGWNVTFQDENGNVLQSGPLRIGETPVFSGELPAIENENDYLWIWDKEIVPVADSDVTYTGSWRRAVAEVIKKDNPDDPNPMRFHELQLAINAAEDGDTVRLLVDIPLTSKVTVAGKSITLDGDGHTITRGKKADGAWYTGTLLGVSANASLVLDGNLIIDGAHEWIFDETGYFAAFEDFKVTLKRYNGSAFISNVEGAPIANADMIGVSGTLTINNATIRNHKGGSSNRAIGVYSNANLMINDGALITHIVSTYGGSVISMSAGSNFVMNGGKISNNHTIANGMIYLTNATMNMNGGVISDNHAVNCNGSVLMLYSGSKFVLNGGEICRNSALAGDNNSFCPAIYVHGGFSSMEMHGGYIYKNIGFCSGGILANTSSAKISIDGGWVVENVSMLAEQTIRPDLIELYAPYNDLYPSSYTYVSGITYFTQDVNKWCTTEYIAVPQELGSKGISEDFTLWIVDKTSIESISQEKEIFGTVTDSANTNINNDSAYTVEINVNHFYNKCYLSPEIHFSQNLPVNTTIILRDIDKDAPGYWAYTVKTETNSIPLSEFVRMGSTETFSTPMVKPAFRFVIDFSKTENGIPSGSLETSLKLIPATTLPADNENYYKSGAVYWVPESEAENFEGTVAISPVENILLADKKFTLETDTNGGFSSTIDYDVVINAEASKWDYREFALIINIPEAPTDAVLSALVNGSERTIIPYTPGNYIIPLGSVFKGQVIITLESNMFPINGKEYTATCNLYASESVADSSPLNGELLVQKTEGLFTKTDDYASIKVTGPMIDAVEKHVFDDWDEVTVTVDKIIPDNYTIEIQLEQKDSNGNYVKMENKTAEQDGNTYTFDLDDFEPDSYRIVVFALRTSDGFVSAQAPYYFIVE